MQDLQKNGRTIKADPPGKHGYREGGTHDTPTEKYLLRASEPHAYECDGLVTGGVACCMVTTAARAAPAVLGGNPSGAMYAF